MSQGKVIATLMLMIAGFGVVIHIFTRIVAPPEGDQIPGIIDISRPRAPSEARKIANPFAISSEIIAEGDELYHNKGSCHICHGEEGKGDGQAGAMLSPAPRDLSDPGFQMLRTDGELFWSIKHGVQGTGMFSYSPRMISEEEVWKVIHYVRTLNTQENSPSKN